MRSIYELSESNSNLYIGSTSTLTPNQYIRDLSDLSTSEFHDALKQSILENGGKITPNIEMDEWWCGDNGEDRLEGSEHENDDFHKIAIEFK